MPMPLVTIDSNGVHVPPYDEYREALVADFRGIYGNDIYVAPDSQDGQLISILALAQYDSAQSVAAAYHSFNPNAAVGTGLSRLVRINGISRMTATRSQCDVKLIGVAGTVVRAGIVADVYKNKWDLPPLVTIPPAGEIIVTATAQQSGAIRLAPGELNVIVTMTRGWQTVSNDDASTPGDPVETDFELRTRRRLSTSLPSLSVLEGLTGAIANLTGVSRVKPYENWTGTTDANGVPGHSICMVVEGGDAQAIANMIRLKKTPGTGTFGSTSITTVDSKGVSLVINFERPEYANLAVQVYLKVNSYYDGVTATKIATNLAAYSDTLPIGDDVLLNRLYAPIYRADDSFYAPTFDIDHIMVSSNSGAFTEGNIPIAFNERCVILASSVQVIVSQQ